MIAPSDEPTASAMQADAVVAALARAYRSEWACVLSGTVRLAVDVDVATQPRPFLVSRPSLTARIIGVETKISEAIRVEFGLARSLEG